MPKPVGLLEVGKNYDVIVTKILSKGIIVQIGNTEYTDFIHISKISTEYVSNINEFVHVGDRLSALAIIRGGKGENSEPELTLKHLNLKSLYNIDDSNSNAELIAEVSDGRNLDAMIAAANLSLQDKVKTIKSRTERKRRNPKRKSKF